MVALMPVSSSNSGAILISVSLIGCRPPIQRIWLPLNCFQSILAASGPGRSPLAGLAAAVGAARIGALVAVGAAAAGAVVAAAAGAVVAAGAGAVVAAGAAA